MSETTGLAESAASTPAAEPPLRVLVVDDFAMDRRLVGKILGQRSDLEVVYAEDGKEALAAIQLSTPDLVLTDIHMPELDGLSLVSEVRHHWPLVPTIIMTAHGSEDTALAALRTGAASYVPKRFLARDLLETVDSVLAAAGFEREQQKLQEHWLETDLKFRLANDPGLISPLVLQVQRYLRECSRSDETEIIRIGIALQEALSNAMLCGNLELEGELRRKSPDEFARQAEARRATEPYVSRRVHVTISETPFEGRYLIRDEGPGFDAAAAMELAANPSSLDRSHGRGLVLIRNFMTEVHHGDHGREITMIHRHR